MPHASDYPKPVARGELLRILRGWERLKWRLREMKTHDQFRFAATEQKARIDWAGRSFSLSYWGEGGEEKASQ